MTTRRRLPWGVLALLAIVAAFAVPKLLPRSAGSDDTLPEPAGGTPALEVQVVELTPRHLSRSLTTTGTLSAVHSVELVTEIAGKVESILFEEGRTVAAGSLLVKIDDVQLQAERERVFHRLELARQREARQAELLQLGVVAQQEYDFAASELAVLQAELRLVEARLEKTEIRAPFAGTVGLRRVSEGAYLTPQTTIARLQDLDPIRIDFGVPERYAARIRSGGRIAFRVQGFDQAFEGTVVAVEPTVDPATRSLTVRASSANPGGLLLPGAFADVELVIAEIEDALVVPAMAVVPELGGKKVFVVEDGVASPRSVETGIRTETDVEIVAGLRPGERVIVSAIQRLRAGLPVRATTIAPGGAEGTAP